MQIKFLDAVTARMVLDYDPDTMDTLLETEEFEKDEFCDIRDVYWNDGERSCVEFSDGSVSLFKNDKIEIIDKISEADETDEVYELTEKDILPFVPVDIATDEGIQTINLDF